MEPKSLYGQTPNTLCTLAMGAPTPYLSNQSNTPIRFTLKVLAKITINVLLKLFAVCYYGKLNKTNLKLSSNGENDTIFFEDSSTIILCVNILPLTVCIYHLQVWHPKSPKEGAGSHVTRVTDSRESQ